MTGENNSDSFCAWAEKSQPGEKSFHLASQWRNTPYFMEHTTLILEAFGFDRRQFQGQTIVDVGAGSKLRSRCFLDARIAAIEPLGDDFVREIEWCDLAGADWFYSLPAEQRIEELCDQADFAMCINVLDHTYDPAAILRNVHSYLKPSGRFLLSVDLHDGDDDDLHPVALDVQSLNELVIDCGFAIERAYQYLPGLPAYGHGCAHTLVLKPRAAGEDDGRGVEVKRLMSPWEVRARRAGEKLSGLRRKLRRLFGGKRAA